MCEGASWEHSICLVGLQYAGQHPGLEECGDMIDQGSHRDYQLKE